MLQHLLELEQGLEQVWRNLLQSGELDGAVLHQTEEDGVQGDVHQPFVQDCARHCVPDHVVEAFVGLQALLLLDQLFIGEPAGRVRLLPL